MVALAPKASSNAPPFPLGVAPAGAARVGCNRPERLSTTDFQESITPTANDTAHTGAPRKSASELTRFYLWLIPLFFALHWVFGAR